MNVRAAPPVTFGPFALHAAERLLLRDDEPVSIGSRALEILMILTERAGDVVGKRDIIARVWPGMAVDDSSLRVHMSGLRRALGEGEAGARFITNVTGRGYCFVASVGEPLSQALEPAAPPPPVAAAPEAARATLPPMLKRMVGRDALVFDLAGRLLESRFLTVVGAGGMGKTTVAVAVAHALCEEFGADRTFVDLSQIREPALAASALAAALDVAIVAEDPLLGLLAALRERRALLVFDCCEHVVETAAGLAESIVQACPQVHVLATSREALRAEGEELHWLASLEGPSDTAGQAASDILAYPAVQLFIDRARASGGRLDLDEMETAKVAAICARLDGLALALELAAGSVGAFGLDGAAALLDNRFRFVLQGRRTALPRHQTLSAMLDWSYQLLPEPEKLMLARLSAFNGGFGLDDAQGLAQAIDADTGHVSPLVLSLVAKSLVSAEPDPKGMRFRLLETTRAYAAERLEQLGEAEAAGRALTRLCLDWLTRDSAAIERLVEGDVLAERRRDLGSVRAALNFCLERPDLARSLAALAAAASPLFLELSLLHECRLWARRALDGLSEADAGSMLEIDLQRAYGVATMYATGNSPDARQAMDRALNLARSLDLPAHQLLLLVALNIFDIRVGDRQSALAQARTAADVASALSDDKAMVMADALLTVSHQLLGDQVAAARHGEAVLSRTAPPARAARLIKLGYDHRVRAMTFLARALWLRGAAPRAVALGETALAEAFQAGHPATVGMALVYIPPVMMAQGDLARATALNDRLADHAQAHGLQPYAAVALGMRGRLAILQGELEEGLALLELALGQLADERYHALDSSLRGSLAEALGRIGRGLDGLDQIDFAIRRAGPGLHTFDGPELLRVRGDLLNVTDPVEASLAYVDAMDLAREQGALAWEIRAGLSLAAHEPDHPDVARLPALQAAVEAAASSASAVPFALLHTV